jgi:lantibiotic modifying enzyme
MYAAGYEGHGDLLVVGTRGTLEPNTALLVLRHGERLAREELPPFMEELLEPWLDRAAREVNAVRELATSYIAGEPIPLHGLLRALKNRLSEFLSLALGQWSTDMGATAFWRTFSALRWLVASSVQDWVEATALFIHRLAHDQKLLAQSLGGSCLPAIAFIEATTSDLHPRGAMVLKVGFGGGRCVFYKPRPVTGEWLWWSLLQAISADMTLPAGRVFFGGRSSGYAAYGWMESVLEDEAWPAPLNSEQTGSHLSYWENAGAVVCLAQHLRLTDLHMGNVLATPHGPAITDAECLGLVSDTPSAADGFKHATHALRKTGLLPLRLDPDGVDVSGLFGRAVPISGLRLSGWAVSQTGAWRLAAWPAALAHHRNLPKNATAGSHRTVAAQLCSGYRLGAELLMQARKQLLASGSAWRRILESRHAPRCVLRETFSYGKLLSNSLSALNGTNQSKRCESLTGMLLVSGAALPDRVVQAELRALMSGSIPRLTISQGGRSLRDSDGRTLQRDFTAFTPAEAVIHELESLTPARLQESLLPALLAVLL